MQLGMVGLGRMGSNLVQRLQRGGHHCVGTDRDPAAVEALASSGAQGATNLAELVASLSQPRSVWVMIPAGLVDDVVADLAGLLSPGDTILDGGNSFYGDDIRRARELSEQGIDYLDVGTSGGVYGLERGFCLMVGGQAEVFDRHEPLFATLAPGMDAAPRTPSHAGPTAPGEPGYLHCGPAGAGHFVKMVHNGIEYAMMAALAEGLGILERAGLGHQSRPSDAETAPLGDPDAYRYDFDVAAVSEVWRRGSVVASWLLDLTAEALASDGSLADYSGRVADSGEGRWTVQAAVDLGVPAHVITASLYQRFASRGNGDFAARALSAMRHQFGGHVERRGP